MFSAASPGHSRGRLTLAAGQTQNMDSTSKRVVVQHTTANYDFFFFTLPAQGLSRAFFLANTQGPAPLRNKRYPDGFPCLSQHAERVNESVTVDTAVLLVLSFAAMTQNNTGLVLFASEERGKAHFVEPCSWWQTEDVQHLAELGANRGAFHTCERVQNWTKQRCDKAISFGFMANGRTKATEVKEGCTNLGPEQTYLGPLCKHLSAALISHSVCRNQEKQTSAHQSVPISCSQCYDSQGNGRS